MKHHAKTIHQLKDLIKINSERIKDYQDAIDCLKGERKELSIAYSKMIEQSLQFKTELENTVIIYGGALKDYNPGSIFEKWLALKDDFKYQNIDSSHDICISCEDALLKAYKKLTQDTDIDRDTRELLDKQHQKLEKYSCEIKNILEEYETIHS
ncbi:conserved hypothetical protein [Pustulibacterium marinum]|uniref:DUF2383 domain-containing protein n=1 Tax=Pustulibacterium marinum TaxID=1224947 RepID=A0A1I7H636_9FLAO|nr:hypothetical protein [Pustulibacterium marinum]SFU56119.1 conserved hypothetical protein [Pustulibacterium marinum]